MESKFSVHRASVKELKQYIWTNCGSTDNCIEKDDLIKIALDIEKKKQETEWFNLVTTTTTTYSDTIYVILIAESGGSAMSNCFIGKAYEARKYITVLYNNLGIDLDIFKRRVAIMKYEENMEFSCDVYMCNTLNFQELI